MTSDGLQRSADVITTIYVRHIMTRNGDVLLCDLTSNTGFDDLRITIEKI